MATRLSDIQDLVTPRTATGVLLNILEPEKTPIRSMDILNRLPYTYRYGGDIPVSVLTHTALGLRIIDMMLFGLLRSVPLALQDELRRRFAKHDLHEVFAMEIPTGNKRLICFQHPTTKEIISYRDFESRWENRISRALGMDPSDTSLDDLVTHVDLLCLVIEMQAHHHAGYAYALEYVVKKYGNQFLIDFREESEAYLELLQLVYKQDDAENLERLKNVFPQLKDPNFEHVEAK